MAEGEGGSGSELELRGCCIFRNVLASVSDVTRRDTAAAVNTVLERLRCIITCGPRRHPDLQEILWCQDEKHYWEFEATLISF